MVCGQGTRSRLSCKLVKFTLPMLSSASFFASADRDRAKESRAIWVELMLSPGGCQELALAHEPMRWEALAVG